MLNRWLADLPWEAIGAIAGTAAVAVTLWQIYIGYSPPKAATGMLSHSFAPPLGRLPEVRGRTELVRHLERRFRSGGKVQVLTGMGGIGKSTVALALCAALSRRAPRQRPLIWWVPATDTTSLTAAMLSISRELGASDGDLRLIELGSPSAIHILWELLQASKKRWLLVIDNADQPSLLANREYPSLVSDGTGWIRESNNGLVVVTTRVADANIWGPQSELISVNLLSDEDSADVLLQIASAGGTTSEAIRLARRLGNLPLALQLAAKAIDEQVSPWPTFEKFLERLDEDGPAILSGDPDPLVSAGMNITVMRTWEASLDTLGSASTLSRLILRILACFAPATPIPLDMVDSEVLHERFADRFDPHPATDSQVRMAIRSLSGLGLLEIQTTNSTDSSILVHSLVAETNRRHIQAESGPAWTKKSICEAAAEMVHKQICGIHSDNPISWVAWRQLVPHLRSVMIVGAGSFGEESVSRLLTDVERAMEFFSWVGDHRSGLEIGKQAERLISPMMGESLAPLALRGAIAMAEGELGYWKEPAETLRSLVAAAERTDADSSESLRLVQCLGYAVRESGDLCQAESIFRSVLRGRERALGPDHPDTLDSLHELGRTISAQGRHQEARTLFEDLVRKREDIAGGDNPRTLAAAHELATELRYVGALEEAFRRIQHVYERRTELLGGKHFGTLDSRGERAFVTVLRGDPDAGIHELRVVREIWADLLGAEHPRTLSAGYALAEALELAGRPAEALVELRPINDLQVQLLGPDHPQSKRSLAAYERLGETD